MEYYKNLDLADIEYFCEYDLIWKTEQWRDVLGYEGLYEVSNLGRIKSNNYRHTKKSGIRCQGNASCGYLNIGFNKNNKYKTYLTHRLVATAFIPNPKNKPQVNHKKGNKKNNVETNLEWNTCAENSIHSYEVGLSNGRKGIKHHSVKLTEKQVIEIKESNANQIFLAKKYSICQQHVSKIKAGKLWNHI